MEYPLCSCDEMWCGEGRHAPDCPVVAEFDRLRKELEYEKAWHKTGQDTIVNLTRAVLDVQQRAEAAEAKLADHGPEGHNFTNLQAITYRTEAFALRAVVEAAQRLASVDTKWVAWSGLDKALDALEVPE